MSGKTNWLLKNIHLLVSVAIVVPAAIIYGSPSLLPGYLQILANTTDLSNLLKAIMCLYLAIALVWLMGILQPQHWKAATQLNIVFMLALATGRFISMVIDGIPTAAYIFAVIAEYIIGLFAVYQLKKFGQQSNERR
jgi:hypothetical protein